MSSFVHEEFLLVNALDALADHELQPELYPVRVGVWITDLYKLFITLGSHTKIKVTNCRKEYPVTSTKTGMSFDIQPRGNSFIAELLLKDAQVDIVDVPKLISTGIGYVLQNTGW